jgi:hypothetical protein
MVQSTNGEISFGIMFEEGYEFPWDAEEWDGDVKDWWIRSVCGYTDPFDMYDENGNYIDGIEPKGSREHEYWDSYSKFSKEHPIPVELVNYCRGDCEMYILAVPGSAKTANRGFPVVFSPSDLTVTPEQASALIDLCEKYCNSDDAPKFEPRWYLSSYWG